MRSKGIAILLGITVGVTAGYLASTTFMRGRMMPGTMINGADFSMVQRSELNQRLSDMERNSYSLTVRDIHGNETVINGSDIDLKADFSESDIRVQNPLIYPYYMLKLIFVKGDGVGKYVIGSRLQHIVGVDKRILNTYVGF